LEAGELAEAARGADDAERWAARARVEPWGLVASALRCALATRGPSDRDPLGALNGAIERLGELGGGEPAALALELAAHAHGVLGDPVAAVRALERAAAHADRAGDASYARRLRARAEARSAP
ncbi:MAG: hypothetical protein KF729_32705, partial [Sandaracinaceae bacterium]|nr:hypothetical protein [Sandaracinaceae bacterium]